MKPHEEEWLVMPGSTDKATGQKFGPWHVLSKRGHVVASYIGDGCSDTKTADLIAAAPEMARVLIELECCVGPGSLPYQVDSGRHGRLLAALRKAGVR